MLKLLVLAAVLSVTYASSNKCPLIVGKYPFDEAKFSGEWKVIAGSPLIGGPHKCGKFEYKATKDIHTLKYSGIKEDKSIAVGDAYGQVIGKGGSASYAAVWRKDTEKYSPVFKQAVVATDYDDYSLLVACTHVFDENSKAFIRVLKAGILTRSGKISPEKLETLKSILTGYDFDNKDLITVDQSDC